MSGTALLGVPPALWLGTMLAVVVYSDLRHMRIPNALLLVILALFLTALLPVLPWTELAWRLTAAGVVFALCIGAFAAQLLGGGDTKMLPLLVLFIPAQDWALFALFLSAGLIVTLVGVRVLRLLPREWLQPWRGLARDDRFPLGPGIGLAGIGYCLFGSQVAQLF